MGMEGRLATRCISSLDQRRRLSVDARSHVSTFGRGSTKLDDVLTSSIGIDRTFNAYYFLSILLGLGLGESLFGRFGRRAITSAVPPTSDNSFSHSDKAGQSSQSNALVQNTNAAQHREARDDDDDEANETANSEDQKHEDSSAIPLTTLNH